MQINTERVLQAIRVLEEFVEDDAHHFDMSQWYMVVDTEVESAAYGHPCGTTACAGGWMALDPWHNDQGLRLVGGRPHWTGSDSESDYQQLADYLGISCQTSYEIFYLSPDREAVIAQLRELLEEEADASV